MFRPNVLHGSLHRVVVFGVFFTGTVLYLSFFWLLPHLLSSRESLSDIFQIGLFRVCSTDYGELCPHTPSTASNIHSSSTPSSRVLGMSTFTVAQGDCLLVPHTSRQEQRCSWALAWGALCPTCTVHLLRALSRPPLWARWAGSSSWLRCILLELA